MSDPTDVLERGAETYRTKNDDYGDSWRLVGRIIWELAGSDEITLESPRDVVEFGLYTRRLDKMARAIQGYDSDETNHESIFDSHSDEAVYAAMQASLYDDSTEDERQEQRRNSDVSYSGPHITRCVEKDNAATD